MSSATVSTMDQVVALIQSTESLEALQKDTVVQLRKLDKASTTSTSVLESSMDDDSDPLQVLDPSRHSAGYLFILNARLSMADVKIEELLPSLNAFCAGFDREQMRVVPDQVSFLTKTLAQLVQASQLEGTFALLQSFRTLVMRCSEPGHLTALHPFFLQVILNARVYYLALELVMIDTIDVDHSLGQVRCTEHLSYHYLGGVILALLNHYERAIDFLEIVVSAPGQAVSLIQLDAYKKLVLIQLLAHGYASALPKYTAAAVHASIKNHCAAYTELASAFAKLDKPGVLALVEKHGATFGTDLNSGLVKRYIAALRRRQIEKLTETYMTLSLGDLCGALGLDKGKEEYLKDVQDELVQMISEKQIFGSINPPSDPSSSLATTTVTFTDDPSPFTSHETLRRLASSIATTQRLIAQSDASAKEIERSKEFVSKAYAAAGNQASAMAAGAGMGMMGGPDFGDDLDVGDMGGEWGGDDD